MSVVSGQKPMIDHRLNLNQFYSIAHISVSIASHQLINTSHMKILRLGVDAINLNDKK